MLGSLWFRSFSSGGAAADYELISTTVLGSSQASVTFSGLGTSAAAYKHLQIRATMRTDRAGNASDFVTVRLNSDSGSNYSYHQLDGVGTGMSVYGAGSQTNGLIGYFPAATGTTSNFGASITDLLDFSSTNKNKTIRSLMGFMDSSAKELGLTSAGWYNTSAVTSITYLSGTGANFVSGSRFSLYGIKG